MAPRLILTVASPAQMSPDILSSAIGEGDVACVFLQGTNVPKPLITIGQQLDCAMLLEPEEYSRLNELDADGVCFMTKAAEPSAIKLMRDALGSDKILGSIADTRHGAMELAEAGAEFVAFDLDSPLGPELVGWWGEVAQTPMIALHRGSNEPALSVAARKSVELSAEFFAFPAGVDPVVQVRTVSQAIT